MVIIVYLPVRGQGSGGTEIAVPNPHLPSIPPLPVPDKWACQESGVGSWELGDGGKPPACPGGLKRGRGSEEREAPPGRRGASRAGETGTGVNSSKRRRGVKRAPTVPGRERARPGTNGRERAANYLLRRHSRPAMAPNSNIVAVPGSGM